MRDTSKALALLSPQTDIAASPWKVGPAPAPHAPTPRQNWLGRLLHRREATVYQRCLAVHIHHAGPHSALS
jgi:hypothetical protein